MSELGRESLRNVLLISSAGAGKTSLAEAMLFAAGAVPHLGSIAQGTTVSDFERKSCTGAVPSVPVSSVVPGITPPSTLSIPPARCTCSERQSWRCKLWTL